MSISKAFIEQDPVKNKVADAILELSRNTDLTDIPDALIEVAGRRALANRCYFIFMPHSDEERENFTVFSGFTANLNTENEEREGLISAILPDCSSCCEFTWEFDTPMTVEEGAKKLQAAGFEFIEEQQNRSDKKYTARIKKALGAEGAFNEKSRKAPKKAAQAQPKGPKTK